MSKLPLNNLVNLQNETTAVNTINTNNAAITTAFDNTLSRDGTSPNTMSANFDMNSNRILNLPLPVSNTEPLRLVDAQTLGTGGTLTINVSNFSIPNGGATGTFLRKNSATNQDANWTTNFAFDDANMKISLRGTQIYYFPTGFTDSSIFIGNGGGNLLHTGGLEGYYNTMVGMTNALSMTTGKYNTGVGFEVMEFCTTGSYNTAIGEAGLIYNITGNGNTACGWKALLGNPGVGYGDYNTAVGYFAGSGATTTAVTKNTAVGGFTMSGASLTGTDNTAIGYGAGIGISSGTFNTLLGEFAGPVLTTGGFNTLIGYNAGNGLTTGTGNVVIGNSTVASNLTNSVVIGDNAVGAVRFSADGNGNIRFNGGAAMATNATNGFVQIQSMSGTPTGVPTDFNAGKIPMVFDSSSNKLWMYNSAWHSVTLT